MPNSEPKQLSAVERTKPASIAGIRVGTGFSTKWGASDLAVRPALGGVAWQDQFRLHTVAVTMPWIDRAPTGQVRRPAAIPIIAVDTYSFLILSRIRA